MGIIATGVAIYEDFHDDKLGAGTVVKGIMGGACVIFPGFGLGYAIFDLGYAAVTGTTFTDSVANGVDNLFKGEKDE